MQTQGSLAEANLASLLHTMQSERATGTLTLENGQATIALFFLFGHLFHAAGPSGQGEDVVIDALAWGGGTFKFDPRAKLPAEETIKSSPGDLIAEAEHRGGAPTGATQWASSGGGDQFPAAAEGAAAEPGLSSAGSGSTSSWGRATISHGNGSGDATTDQAPAEEAGVAPGDEAAKDPDDNAHDPPTYGSWDQPATTGPEEAATYTTWSPQAPAETSGLDDDEPAEQPSTAVGSGAAWGPPQVAEVPVAQADAPFAAVPFAAAPEPPPLAASVAAVSADPGAADYGRRSTDAAPVANVYPLPSGRAIYERLKTAFVDFPKLLTTLRKDSHTGYARLTCDEFVGVLLFQQGNLVEALAKVGAQQQGEAAFREFQDRMEAGEGLLDVIELAGVTVGALAQLLLARPLFTGLLGRFTNFKNLLEYLAEERVDGSVIVATDADFGVILLRQGAVDGAYTKSDPTLDSSTAAIEALAAHRSARIEVKGGAGQITGIDVDRMLAQR